MLRYQPSLIYHNKQMDVEIELLTHFSGVSGSKGAVSQMSFERPLAARGAHNLALCFRAAVELETSAKWQS